MYAFELALGVVQVVQKKPRDFQRRVDGFIQKLSHEVVDVHVGILAHCVAFSKLNVYNISMQELEEFFQKRIRVTDTGDGRYAVSFPMYKIEGGMYEIYLVGNSATGYCLSDEGATLEALDKIFELGEPDVIKNLVAILRQYGCKKVGNAFQIDCTPKDIHIKMSYLIQAISFMLNMKIFYI